MTDHDQPQNDEVLECSTCHGEGGWYDASRQWETCYRCNGKGAVDDGGRRTGATMTDYDQLLVRAASLEAYRANSELVHELAAALRAALATQEETELAMRAEVRLRSQHEHDLVALRAALATRPQPDPGVIVARVRATFDQPFIDDRRLLQLILDEEGPEALIDAVLAAATCWLRAPTITGTTAPA